MRRSKTRALAIVTAALASGVLAASSGCYQRTVSASGLGASNVPVSQSAQEGNQGWLDRWLFGEPAPRRSGSLLDK